MRQPSQGADVAIGVVCAILGAAATFFLSRSQPPLSSQPPGAPPVQVPEVSIPEIGSFLPPLPDLRLPSLPSPGSLPLPPAVPPLLSQMTPEQLRDRVGMRVYQVIVPLPDGGTGSCGSFPIAPDRIATALHCVNSDVLQFASPDNSQRFTGRLIWTDPGNDAAIAQVDGGQLEPFPLGRAVPGEKVWAFGYPQTMEGRLTVTPSQVESVNFAQANLGLQAPAILLPGGTYAPGNSGGPLINDRGEVVGIAHAIFNQPPYSGVAISTGVLP